MPEHPLAKPKWTLPESSMLSTMMRERVYRTVEANLARLGDVPWSLIVNERTMDLLSAEDSARIDHEVVEEFMAIQGRKLLAGSEVAVAEMPERYVLRSEWEAAQEERVSLDDLPEGAIGRGDNVFRADDVEGTVLVVRQVAEVDRLMTEGVPEGTIGVIDDAGGTMTAPILPEFDGVLCRAGTVRSHLAIIAREYGVPTLMGVNLRRDLNTGDRVRVSYSSQPQNVEAYHGGEIVPQAIVWEA